MEDSTMQDIIEETKESILLHKKNQFQRVLSKNILCQIFTYTITNSKPLVDPIGKNYCKKSDISL